MPSHLRASFRVIFTFAVLLLCGVFAGAQKPSSSSPEDKYVWLEEVSSPRAMEWVNAENRRSMKVFESDPRWQPFVEEAVKLAGNPDRLPVPSLRGTEVYNSWRDKDHPRGVL